MNQASGLLLAAPALLVFVAFMYRRGAMNPAGAITAAVMIVVISVSLYAA
jgi:hypothetical protein